MGNARAAPGPAPMAVHETDADADADFDDDYVDIPPSVSGAPETGAAVSAADDDTTPELVFVDSPGTVQADSPMTVADPDEGTPSEVDTPAAPTTTTTIQEFNNNPFSPTFGPRAAPQLYALAGSWVGYTGGPALFQPADPSAPLPPWNPSAFGPLGNPNVMLVGEGFQIPTPPRQRY